MKSYLPSLQGRNKWKTLRENLIPGQLVLVGDADDISRRGTYRLSRMHALHPQISKGKEIVRRATVAVLGRNVDSSGSKIEYILRDISDCSCLTCCFSKNNFNLLCTRIALANIYFCLFLNLIIMCYSNCLYFICCLK